jgi:hypothetical protein
LLFLLAVGAANVALSKERRTGRLTGSLGGILGMLAANGVTNGAQGDMSD